MSAVLLVNANMEVLHTITLQRAISLVSKGAADIVEAVPGKILRSPSVTWGFPSVLRLRRYVSVPRRKMVWSRKAVFARDGYSCVYCGTHLSREDATVDHLIPVEQCKRQGIRPSTWGNTVTSCEVCNRRKANRSLHDAGMHFLDPTFEPKTPRTNYVIATSDIRPEWKLYLDIGR